MMLKCISVPQMLGDSEVRATCADALQWANRLLPFSGFLNADEILQDLLLSLLAELPPLELVIWLCSAAFSDVYYVKQSKTDTLEEVKFFTLTHL